MKKFLSSAVLAVSLTFGFGAVTYGADDDVYELPQWGEAVIMYVPNRVLDVLDIFSLSAGAGPIVGLDLRLTRLATAGAGVGASAKLVKGYNRQYGVALEEGYNLDLLMLSCEKKETHMSSRFIKKIDIDRTTLVTPNDRVYNFYDGSRDYWSIGFSAAAIAEVEFDLHLVEVVDFITGIFFIDLKADDLDVYEVAGTREIKL